MYKKLNSFIQIGSLPRFHVPSLKCLSILKKPNEFQIIKELTAILSYILNYSSKSKRCMENVPTALTCWRRGLL